jgi:hypothetical protein
MIRRAFLGSALSAVAFGPSAAQSLTATTQSSVAQAPPEPLVWPITTKLQPGIRSFVGHTDTVARRDRPDRNAAKLGDLH